MDQPGSKQIISDMSTGSIVKQLILFSLPLAGVNLLQTFCQAAEMLIIGRYNGASGMSGLNICYIVYGLLTMSAVGFSFGGPILIAQQSGRRKYHLIRKTVRSLFSLQSLYRQHSDLQVFSAEICFFNWSIPLLPSIQMPDFIFPFPALHCCFLP